MSDRIQIPRSEPMKGLEGKDDANKAFCVELKNLANGGEPMAFRHAEFLRQACMKLHEMKPDALLLQWAEMFELQDQASIHRNIRLMIAINNELPDNSKFPIPEAPSTPISALFEKAKELGVNISGYFDESYDHDNITGMTNPFCMTKRPTITATGDLITIFQDSVGVFHVLLIERKNAPGIGELALPGGFQDANESLKQTCLREGDEETNVAELVDGDGNKVILQELTTIRSYNWDPRPGLAFHGTCSAGVLKLVIMPRL